MSFRFELYVPGHSWLHELDPRTKLVFVGLSSILLLSFGHLLLMLLFLVGVHLLLFSARISWERIRRVWAMMLPLTVLIILLWPLFYQPGGETLLQLWRLRVTHLELLQGLAAALRVDALAFVFAMLLLSTDQARLVRGLVKAGLPFEWGLTLAIALRYLPTFYGLYVQITQAQQARGWVIGRGDFVKRLRSYMPVLVAMIISALRTTDNLSMALAARGLGAGPQRSYFRDFRFAPADWVWLVSMVVAFVALMVARFGYGAGVGPW